MTMVEHIDSEPAFFLNGVVRRDIEWKFNLPPDSSSLEAFSSI